MLEKLGFNQLKKPPKPKVVIRLKTTQWVDKRGNIHEKRSLLTLKRQSVGYNFLLDYFKDTGDTRLNNLGDCLDGIYEVRACNLSYDQETGLLDDWDFKLVPYVSTVETIATSYVTDNMGKNQET
jgi:hypothetical protein